MHVHNLHEKERKSDADLTHVTCLYCTLYNSV